MNCSTANNIPFCVYCISTSTYGGGGAAKAAGGGDVYGSCLEISIADVATTVLERPFSCLEILVHWNRLRAGSSSELPLPTTAAAAAAYAASCLLASACLPYCLPAPLVQWARGEPPESRCTKNIVKRGSWFSSEHTQGPWHMCPEQNGTLFGACPIPKFSYKTPALILEDLSCSPYPTNNFETTNSNFHIFFEQSLVYLFVNSFFRQKQSDWLKKSFRNWLLEIDFPLFALIFIREFISQNWFVWNSFHFLIFRYPILKFGRGEGGNSLFYT